MWSACRQHEEVRVPAHVSRSTDYSIGRSAKIPSECHHAYLLRRCSSRSSQRAFSLQRCINPAGPRSIPRVRSAPSFS